MQTGGKAANLPVCMTENRRTCSLGNSEIIQYCGICLLLGILSTHLNNRIGFRPRLGLSYCFRAHEIISTNASGPFKRWNFSWVNLQLIHDRLQKGCVGLQARQRMQAGIADWGRLLLVGGENLGLPLPPPGNSLLSWLTVPSVCLLPQLLTVTVETVIWCVTHNILNMSS